MSRQFGTNITNRKALTQGLKSLIYSFSDLHPSLRDDRSPLSEYLMDANQNPSKRPDIEFNIIVSNGPDPSVSRETVVTRILPRSTFDEIVTAAGDAIEKCTTVTAAPIKFISSLWDKNAVAELKRKNGRVEFLAPDHDGLTIYYGRVDKIVDRVQMVEERQKYLKVLEDIAQMDAARAKAEDEARMEAARAKAKAEDEARMETARAKAKAEDEARMETARAQAKDLLSQMSFVNMTYCRDDSCNRDHHMDMENASSDFRGRKSDQMNGGISNLIERTDGRGYTHQHTALGHMATATVVNPLEVAFDYHAPPFFWEEEVKRISEADCEDDSSTDSSTDPSFQGKDIVVESLPRRQNMPRGGEGQTSFQALDERISSVVSSVNPTSCIMPPVFNPDPDISNVDQPPNDSSHASSADEEDEEDDPNLWKPYHLFNEKRSSGQNYLSTLKSSIDSSGKLFSLTDDQAVEIVESRCTCCGRKIEEGKPINGIDRWESHYGVYAYPLVAPMCQECNSIKLWLAPDEFGCLVTLWVKNMRNILQLCENIRDMDHLAELASRPSDGRAAGIPRTSMSEARKGMGLLVENEITRELIHHTVLQRCAYCAEEIAYGIDRLLSLWSYMYGFLANNNVPCCSQCNVLKLSRKLDDVVVQIFRIHNYQATIDPLSLSARERYFYDTFNSPTGLDVCTWGHSTQQPVEFYINGQRMMARSIYPLMQFKLGKGLVGDEGLELKSVSLPVYKEWQRNVDLDALRCGLGVKTPANQRISLSPEMQVILRKLEAQAIQNDQEDAKKRSNRKKSNNRAHHLSWKDSSLGVSKLLGNADKSDSYHSSDDEDDDSPDQFPRRIHVRKSIAQNKATISSSASLNASSSKRKRESSKEYGEVAAKRKRQKKTCSAEGCTNQAKKGGVCIKHGAKIVYKRCSFEGCTNHIVNGGVCKKHGAKVKLCSIEGCTNQAVKGGVCVSHGARG